MTMLRCTVKGRILSPYRAYRILWQKLASAVVAVDYCTAVDDANDGRDDDYSEGHRLRFAGQPAMPQLVFAPRLPTHWLNSLIPVLMQTLTFPDIPLLDALPKKKSNYFF